MKASEFLKLPTDEQRVIALSLSDNEYLDIVDAVPIRRAEFAMQDDRIYFDDIDEYCSYLERETSLTDPIDVIYSHERAHARCAEVLGVTCVKYFVQIDYIGRNRDVEMKSGAYTATFGPVKLPNLAEAAISVAPLSPSQIDKANIHSFGYPSIDFVAERIHKWNKQDNGLIIPMPGSLEISR